MDLNHPRKDMTMYSKNQIQSLRKKYNKTLWAHIGLSALPVAAAFLLAYSPLFSPEELIPWLVAAGVGLALAIVEYAIERALFKRGKGIHRLMSVFFFIILLLLITLWEAGAFGGYALQLYPLLLGFLFTRPLIPAMGLLRDARRLRDGDPCETVGRMKSGSRREEATAGRDTYLLFEDELTHEVRILRMGSVSPLHRYRVFYLPHSGLAVGEVIPEGVTFDPFGNPIEREVETEGQSTEKPAYSEESYTEKPDYTETGYAVKPDYTEESTEKPWYQNPEAFSANPPKPEPKEDTSMPDPNSPERKRAAKFGVASKVCKVLTFVFFGGMFLGALMAKEDLNPGAMLLTIPFFVLAIILSEVFKSKELKLRCTKRTTAFCIDTVRRRSGKTSTRHPIVEFDVKGVTHTVELSVSCSRDAVGDLYTLCYDPLDPDVVRPERRGLFD